MSKRSKFKEKPNTLSPFYTGWMALLSSLEICAGAGGQALGLEQAGFDHSALVEIDRDACRTLQYNRPTWQVCQADLREFDGRPFRGISLLAGGVPCPPFSVASKQLGEKDERNLFPEAIRLVDEIRPEAVMLENVRGLLDAAFSEYRAVIAGQLKSLGYVSEWRLLNASDFGVPQLRPRVVVVALRRERSEFFCWPTANLLRPATVGETLVDLMGANGWEGAGAWAANANDIAPTLVGGSKKHGGPDLGPTRSRNAWLTLGVDGKGLADVPPMPGFLGIPRLTVRMAARIQGFPDEWAFVGGKTAAYRQVGNAFPPPVARAVAKQIAQCLRTRRLHAVGN